MKNIISFCIILTLFSCKSSKSSVCENSFYEDRGYTVINFINVSEENQDFPYTMPLVDEDYYLKPHYYEIRNDTLIIKPEDGSGIRISDVESFTVIDFKESTKTLKKGEKAIGLFKLHEPFKVITFSAHKNLIFDKCKRTE